MGQSNPTHGLLREDDMSNNPKVGVDPRLPEIEAKVYQLEQERGERLLRQAHALGQQQAFQQVRQQNYLAEANRQITAVFNDHIDAIPIKLAPDERRGIVSSAFSRLNTEASLSTETREAIARGELSPIASRVITTEMAQRYPEKFEQFKQHVEEEQAFMDKVVGLEASGDPGDSWEASILEIARIVDQPNSGHKPPRTEGSDASWARAAYGSQYLGEE